MESLNENLLDLINAHAGDWPVIDVLAKFFATDGVYLIGVIALVMGMIELRNDPRRGIRIGLVAMITLGIAGTLIIFLGTVVTEARPFVHDTDTRLIIRHAADNSFPSDHAAAAAAGGIVAALAWRAWAPLFLALAVLVALARVYVGVHYPGDVLAALAVGTASGVVAWASTAKLTTLHSAHDPATP